MIAYGTYTDPTILIVTRILWVSVLAVSHIDTDQHKLLLCHLTYQDRRSDPIVAESTACSSLNCKNCLFLLLIKWSILVVIGYVHLYACFSRLITFLRDI